MTPSEHHSEVSERQAHAEATYERLFGPRDKSAPDNDPELMEILRRFRPDPKPICAQPHTF